MPLPPQGRPAPSPDGPRQSAGASPTRRRLGAGRVRRQGQRPQPEADRDPQDPGESGRRMLLTWPLAAALAAVVTAVAGLVPPIALAVVAWVQTPDLGLWPVVGLGVRGWLLAHGAAVVTDANRIGMVPLGVTAVCLLTGSGLAGMAAHRARAEADLELSPRTRRSLTLRVAGVFTLAYVLCVAVASALSDLTDQTGRALLGGLVVGGLSGLVGAGRALDWHPTMRWPGWARAIPRAVLAGLSVMVATGALVAAIALLWHRDQVAQLHTMLAPTTAGSVVLLLLQLAWLPNAVLWCSSWALGAGFSVGTGTIVSPAHTLTGMLPAIPLLGAIGPSGPGPVVSELWMLSGVLAGIVAAVVVVRARPGHRAGRLDEDSLVGGLAGVLTGLALWLLCAASNGDLGSVRLAGVGARLVPLAVMAPTVMGISGLLAGLVCSLLARRRGSRAAARLEDVVEHPGAGSGSRTREDVGEPTRTSRAVGATKATAATGTVPTDTVPASTKERGGDGRPDANDDDPADAPEAHADRSEVHPTDEEGAGAHRVDDPEEPTVQLAKPAEATGSAEQSAPAEQGQSTQQGGPAERTGNGGGAGAGERTRRGPILRGAFFRASTPKPGEGRVDDAAGAPRDEEQGAAGRGPDDGEGDSGATVAPR